MNIEAVTIRPVQPEDLDAVAHVRAVSFGGDKDRALNGIKNNPRIDISHLLAAEYEGEIIGTAAAFPAKMWLSGVPVNVGAVAAVAVLPEQRETGVAGKLMEYMLPHFYDEGQALSVLFPFSHKYYAKFGYGTISDLHAYRIRTNNLTVSEEGHNVRPYSPDDLPIMRVLYKGQSTWHNGWFTRTNEWWDILIDQWPNIMVYDDGDMVQGYYAYEPRRDDEGQEILHITEFFAAEPQAFRGLLSYLAAQSEAEIIEYLAPADTALRHSLRQPVAVDAQNRGWMFNDLCHVIAGPMGRIINLSKALTSRFYTRGMSGERVIKVSDPLVPANEEPIVFRLVDGRAETHPAEDRAPQIETDITTLTQVVCGYMTAMDAYRLGRFQTDEDTCSWLDKITVDSPLFIQGGDWF